MKGLRRLGIALIVIAAAAAVVGYLLPSQVAVQRAVTIDAPKSEVFAIISSLRAFSRWSPWNERDPKIQFSFEGPDSGVGQKMKWQSQSSEVGNGSMEIADSVRGEKLVMNIDFSKSADARSTLALDDVAGGTRVTWSFDYVVGGNPFARYIALMMPGVVGREYERGLERLKKYVEAIPPVDFSDLAVERVSVSQRILITVEETTANTPEGMNKALGHAFKTLSAAMQSAGLAGDGPPISVAEGVTGGEVKVGVSYPVKGFPPGVKLPDGVRSSMSEQGLALRIHHKGDTASFQKAYVELLAYAMTKGWKIRGSSWNEYPNGIGKMPGPGIEADIYLPVE